MEEIDMEKEYEKTELTFDRLKDYVHELSLDKKELQQRIEKAIEYIEENLQPYENNLPIIAIDYQNVIFLLKGSDKK